MGDFNRSVILDAIRRATKGLSRVELGHATGLSAQTVSNICRKLLDQGFVEEAGKASSGPGKPRTILRLKPDGAFAIGVHLDPAVMTFVILDLTGAVVHSRKRTPIVDDPNQVIITISAEIEKLTLESGIERSRIAGIGIAAPGPIDPVRGAVIDPPNLLGWHQVPLRDALADATGLPVIVGKDVTAAAVAETWVGGAIATGSFVFFYLGTGVGAGLVLSGDVVRGSSSNAGEIGHVITDPNGPPCACGLRGCVAVTCAAPGLVLEAEQRGVLAATGLHNEAHAVDEQFTILCARAENGDSVANEILDRSAFRVAKAVSVITNLLDVDRVVFGGPFWARVSERYLRLIPPLLDELTDARSVHRVEVVGTGVGEDVGAIGAACLVLDDALAPRAARLLLAE
ncbi:MAG: ROK family transcriptional regulator [Leifsonia sp.]